MRSIHCNVLEYDLHATILPDPSDAFIPDRRNWPNSVAYPMGVIWPGFAINTIFYAGILWLLFTACGFVRRRIMGGRIMRHHCPACAYPVGARGVCTECGTTFHSVSR